MKLPFMHAKGNILRREAYFFKEVVQNFHLSEYPSHFNDAPAAKKTLIDALGEFDGCEKDAFSSLTSRFISQVQKQKTALAEFYQGDSSQRIQTVIKHSRFSMNQFEALLRCFTKNPTCIAKKVYDRYSAGYIRRLTILLNEVLDRINQSTLLFADFFKNREEIKRLINEEDQKTQALSRHMKVLTEAIAKLVAQMMEEEQRLAGIEKDISILVARLRGRAGDDWVTEEKRIAMARENVPIGKAMKLIGSQLQARAFVQFHENKREALIKVLSDGLGKYDGYQKHHGKLLVPYHQAMRAFERDDQRTLARLIPLIFERLQQSYFLNLKLIHSVKLTPLLPTGSWADSGGVMARGHLSAEEYAGRLADIMINGLRPSTRSNPDSSNAELRAVYFSSEANQWGGGMSAKVMLELNAASNYAVFSMQSTGGIQYLIFSKRVKPSTLLLPKESAEHDKISTIGYVTQFLVDNHPVNLRMFMAEVKKIMKERGIAYQEY